MKMSPIKLRGMNAFDSEEIETILSGDGDWLDSEAWEALATHPLSCIQTEYPHWVAAIEDPDDITEPSSQHPIFYGCYDWHSAVHSHWSLIRQLRLNPEHPLRDEILEVIDGRLTSTNVADEVAYLEDNPRFERPYGWGWFLRLIVEVHLWDSQIADRWREMLRPLETTVTELFETEFLSMDRPLRVGTHGNSAFGLSCLLDYARVVGASDLEASTCNRVRTWYLDDVGYSFDFEPLGWDFLSPGLEETSVMARVLDQDDFIEWFEGFVSSTTTIPLEPMAVDPDEGDGQAMHLIGLDLSRAWSSAMLSDRLEGTQYETTFQKMAEAHAIAGLEGAFPEDYAGSHWLSSYALFLITRNAGGIYPNHT